jgi:hypothetical protein
MRLFLARLTLAVFELQGIVAADNEIAPNLGGAVRSNAAAA